MAYTTENLVADAFYASGIVSRQFEVVSATQQGDGFAWLNELLGCLIVESDLIPYETTYYFTAVINQEVYEIPDLISVDTLTFDLNSVRFPMTWVPRDQYKGQGRVQTISSLPYQFYVERDLTGAKLYMYFLPNQAYPFTINGIFRLSNVAQGQDLSLTLNSFYTVYLKYRLAVKICAEYAQAVPQSVMSELDQIRSQISKNSRPLDLSLRKISTLHQKRRLGWAWVNLGEGYLP